MSERPTPPLKLAPEQADEGLSPQAVDDLLDLIARQLARRHLRETVPKQAVPPGDRSSANEGKS